MIDYYESPDGRIKLYRADCRSFLPSLAPGLVYLTDQPYGTGWVRGGKGVGEFQARHEKPDWDVWNLDWLTALNQPARVAAFCPAGRQEELQGAMPGGVVLKYRKSNVRPGGLDFEPIVCSPPPRREPWEKTFYNGDMPYHPCQKPLDLMGWLVSLVSEPSETVVDCFMGSGTTAIACRNTGRRFIGCELDPDYFKAAVARIEREYRQPDMFLPAY